MTLKIVKNKRYSSKGFTLIELLLVIALVLVVSVPTAAFSSGFIYQTSVRDAADGLVGMLREAQILAISGKENSAWGVKREADKFILFRGENFSNRDQSFDQALAFNSNIGVSGFDEVSFSLYDGFPAQELSPVITWGNVSESFSLNSEGAVE